MLVAGSNNFLAGNVLAHNRGAGLAVASGTGNDAAANSFYANGGPGIDLGNDGPTPNDATDGDGGPNTLQNFPVLSAASYGPEGVSVSGTVRSTPGTPLSVALYASPTGDGEGRTHLDTLEVTTDGAGLAGFSTTLPPLPAGQYLTATATAPGFDEESGVVWGHTSEFSLPLAVASAVAAGGRHVFYNNSAFDGNRTAADAGDDGAIATDKRALLPGGTASFANYTSYSRGINGVILDVIGLPPSGTPPLSAADFAFRLGNSSDPSTWAAAPAPAAVRVRRGEGIGASDRVTITWADGAIKKTWLQVTTLANARTGLVTPDVFYFGNAVGESGNWPTAALVNHADELGARHRPRGVSNPAPATYQWDYNRDRQVNVADVMVARRNRSAAATALRLITAPAGPAAFSTRAAAAADGLFSPTPIGGLPQWPPEAEGEELTDLPR